MGIISLPKYGTGIAQGSTEFAILGTGDSGPVGIEATIEYNGMLLNQRKWIDTFLITSIDGLQDADIRDQREVNPAQHGETAFSSFYGGRTVVLGGRIRAHHIWRLRDMQLALREAFTDLNTEHALVLHHHNKPGKSLAIYCRKSQPIAMGDVQQNFEWTRDFQITMRASNPRFLGLALNSITLDSSKFNSDVVISVNEGNFNAQPIITLANAMTTPELFNETLNKSIKFQKNIAAGEQITLDIGRNTMLDREGVSAFDRLSPQSDWPEIMPGGNLWSIASSNFGSDALVTIKWRHTVM